MPAGEDSERRLRYYGDEVLRRRCREVRHDEDVAGLVADMLAVMDEHDGIGLAACQVGDPRRVIVVSDPKARRPLVMVNPRLEESFGPASAFEEGCLSFPDLYVDVLRPRGAVLSYRTPDGQERRLRDEDLVARVAQHELDHLDGVLFIDRLPRWRRWLLGWRLFGLRRRAREAAA